MISNPQDLQKAANWEGKGLESRAKLLDKLQGKWLKWLCIYLMLISLMY